MLTATSRHPTDAVNYLVRGVVLSLSLFGVLRLSWIEAHVVLKDPGAAGEAMARELQDFVKSQIAPYKYPRLVRFVSTLPRTETGKLQRFKLRTP